MYGSSQNAGLQFDYIHDNEDANFQLVGMAKPQKPQRTFRRNPAPFRKVMQKDIERRELQYYNQSNKMKRSIAKEQMRAYKLWQRRGGARGGQPNRAAGARRYQDRQGKQKPHAVCSSPAWLEGVVGTGLPTSQQVVVAEPQASRRHVSPTTRFINMCLVSAKTTESYTTTTKAWTRSPSRTPLRCNVAEVLIIRQARRKTTSSTN